MEPLADHQVTTTNVGATTVSRDTAATRHTDLGKRYVSSRSGHYRKALDAEPLRVVVVAAAAVSRLERCGTSIPAGCARRAARTRHRNQRLVGRYRPRNGEVRDLCRGD